MKKYVIVLSILIYGLMVTAQQEIIEVLPNKTTQAVKHDISPPLRDITPIPPSYKNWKDGIVGNNFERRDYKSHQKVAGKTSTATLQDYMGQSQSKAPIVNFDGINKSEGGGATPPDTDGDVSTTHYFQMVNCAFKIFNKTGTQLYPASGAADNSTLWSGFSGAWSGHNDGDPVVLWDEAAQRWFASQFAVYCSNSKHYILVAISQTSDPTGSWHRYAFEWDWNAMPDYPKFGVWHDGYYMTANCNSDNVAVFERDEMLLGNAAQMIQFNLPDVPGSGFKSPLPADCDGTLPPVTEPAYIVYYNDDAWGTYPTDHIRIWECVPNWITPGSSTLSMTTTLPISAFDVSTFSSSWDDIDQPGTSQNLDAIAQAMMFRMQYKIFASHQSIVGNFTVNVASSGIHAGIRWFELRNTGSGWSLYQEGTYAPDSDSRWNASTSIDDNGNIGMAYSISGSSTYPSIRYTGHTNSAALGVMDVTEETIIAGTGNQTGTNRYGDYSALTLDPSDGLTFWTTNEYIPSNGSWRTRIASFKIDIASVPIDIGVVSLVSPTSGLNLTNSETVEVTIRNFGTSAVSNPSVSYQMDGGTVHTETYSGTIASGVLVNHVFATTEDLSATATYNFEAWTTLAADTVNQNDTLNMSVTNTSTASVMVHPEELNIKAMPNPSNGKFTLEFDVLNMDMAVQIIDYTGRTIYVDKVPKTVKHYSKQIDISEQAAGLYFIRIRSAQNNILHAEPIILK
jgi:Secretion system C-terminal sorting domain